MPSRALSPVNARALARACRRAAEVLRRAARLLVSTGSDDEAARAARAAAWLDEEAVDLERRLGLVEGLSSAGRSAASSPARAARLAASWRGTPYVWGGTVPGRGLDCSGLVQVAFARFGIRLPRVSRAQATVGTRVRSLREARPGDLLFYGRPVGHVAVHLGDGLMVEAPRRGLRVRVVPVRTPTSIRRVPDRSGRPGML